jgi:hypothetical protein
VLRVVGQYLAAVAVLGLGFVHFSFPLVLLNITAAVMFSVAATLQLLELRTSAAGDRGRHRRDRAP